MASRDSSRGSDQSAGSDAHEHPDRAHRDTTMDTSPNAHDGGETTDETTRDPGAAADETTADGSERRLVIPSANRVVTTVSMSIRSSIDDIVGRLMRRGDAESLPTQTGVIAPIRRPREGTLTGVSGELDVLRSDASPLLVGIDHNTRTLRAVAETYDVTLAVGSKHANRVEELLPYLPAVIAEPQARGLGAARSYTVPVETHGDEEPARSETLRELRVRNGQPLHSLARASPDFVAFSAPEPWQDPVRDALSDWAPVLEAYTWEDSAIHVVGFVFDTDRTETTTPSAEDEATESDGTPTQGDETANRDGSQDGTDGADACPAGDSAGDGDGTTSSDSAADGAGSGSADAGGEWGDERGGRAAGGHDGRSAANGSSPPDATRESGNETAAGHPTDAGEDSHSSDDIQPIGSDNGDGTPPAGDQPEPGADTPDSGDAAPTLPSDDPGSPSGGNQPAGGPTPDTETEDDTDGDNGPDGQGADGEDDDGRDKSDSTGDKDADGDDAAGADADDAAAGATGSQPEPAADDEGDRATSITPDPEPSPSRADDDSTPDTPKASSNPAAGSSPAGSDSPPGMDSTTGTPSESPPRTDGDGAGTQGGSGGEPPGEAPSGAPNGRASTGQRGDGTPERSTPDDSHPAPNSDGRGSEPPVDSLPNPDPFTPSRALPGDGPAPNSDSDTDSASSTGSRQPSSNAPDDSGGVVPAPKGASTETSGNPEAIDITEHVLNEIATHASAHSDTEVYGTIYANDDGLIRYHHPVESETYVKRRKRAISFKPPFYEHLEELARVHKDIDHRLCGDVHSHPQSGIPRQSPADKRTARRVWKTQRNTVFIVGLDTGDGPDDWTVTDDGYEARRVSNGYLVRVRAYSGQNDPKEIRVHREMGG